MSNFYELSISYDILDSDWDNFLLNTLAGHYVQSSLWAQVHMCLGWRAARLIARQGKEIVSGAQVIFKPSSSGITLGYVPKGPIFYEDTPELRKHVFKELSRFAQTNQISLLIIQPPHNAWDWINQLPEFSFYPSRINLDPTATLIIDLNLDIDEILNQMKVRTRYNIRLSNRKGVCIREGTTKDLDVYYELLIATSQRQQFAIYPKIFFIKLWEIFDPYGYIKLFISEYKGCIVSAQLAIMFRDTVINKLSVWSGECANLKTNEALYWYVICWAKKNGYRYYDLNGIDSHVASAILQNKPIPSALYNSATSYKLGFGGQVILLPGVYDHIYDRTMRIFFDKASEKITNIVMDKNFEL